MSFKIVFTHISMLVSYWQVVEYCPGHYQLGDHTGTYHDIIAKTASLLNIHIHFYDTDHHAMFDVAFYLLILAVPILAIFCVPTWTLTSAALLPAVM